MARWRLTGKHYLSVPGTEWEYRETNRDTGRQARKVFTVPLYLDPEDGSLHNYPGEIIVAYEGSKYPRDIIFTGPPTPDMEPLDDEATAISDKERSNWIHPIESLPGTGGAYADKLFDMLSKQLSEAMNKNPMNVSAAGADDKVIEKMQSDIKALMEQNAKLMAQLKPAATIKV